jgi:hypothetical protein
MATTPNEPIMDDKAVSLPDSTEDQDTFLGNSLIGFIEGRFTRAEEARRSDEERWLRSYRNYRGIYGPDVQFTEAEKSRVFVKVTKTKTLAAYGQITDVLFANNSFPLSIEPTTLPEGVAEHVHIETNPQLKEMEQAGPDLPEGPMGDVLREMLGPLRDQLEGEDVKEGPGVTPTTITYSPAQVAAKKMQKKIIDQLEESKLTSSFVLLRLRWHCLVQAS